VIKLQRSPDPLAGPWAKGGERADGRAEEGGKGEGEEGVGENEGRGRKREGRGRRREGYPLRIIWNSFAASLEL